MFKILTMRYWKWRKVYYQPVALLTTYHPEPCQETAPRKTTNNSIYGLQTLRVQYRLVTWVTDRETFCDSARHLNTLGVILKMREMYKELANVTHQANSWKLYFISSFVTLRRKCLVLNIAHTQNIVTVNTWQKVLAYHSI